MSVSVHEQRGTHPGRGFASEGSNFFYYENGCAIFMNAYACVLKRIMQFFSCAREAKLWYGHSNLLSWRM